MNYLKTKYMAITPVQDGLDLTTIIKWIVACITFILAFWRLVDAYFAAKKRDKQEFIEKVVKATMEVSLADLKKDIAEIRGDVKHFNDTVIKIYTDFKP